MIYRIKNELKVAGSNLYIISAVLVIFLIFLAICAGELLNVSSMGFEVIFPFYGAVAVGEWGKTKADDNYDVIAAQSRSVLEWLTIRYIAVMGMVSIFGDRYDSSGFDPQRNDIYRLAADIFPYGVFLIFIKHVSGNSF